jgi:hypothetical protein
LGKSPAAKHAKPAGNLMLEDNGQLCREFHQHLLQSQADGPQRRRFTAKINLPELPPVDVRLTWAGQTAAVALWSRNGRIGAATVLLNGMEFGQELSCIAVVLASHELNVPDAVWDDIRKQPPPVHANLYFDLYSMTDPLIASASPALANSFFSMFGTNG